jgi:hypothetical protein
MRYIGVRRRRAHLGLGHGLGNELQPPFNLEHIVDLFAAKAKSSKHAAISGAVGSSRWLRSLGPPLLQPCIRVMDACTPPFSRRHSESADQKAPPRLKSEQIGKSWQARQCRNNSIDIFQYKTKNISMNKKISHSDTLG